MINLFIIKFENTVGRDAFTHTWVARRREVWYSIRQHSNTESFAKKSYVYRTETRLLHDFCRRDEGIPPYRLSTDSGIELIIVYIRSKKYSHGFVCSRQ